jgi:cystathionine beta-lyase/cystathionine gamma-synthase
MGVDLVMHGVTKYINGHSDVTAGALAGPTRLMQEIDKTRKLLGGIADPQAAYAIGRGLKTLSVRMGATMPTASPSRAGSTRRRADASPRVLPGLESHPITRSRRNRCAASAAWSVSISPAAGRAERFFDQLEVLPRREVSAASRVSQPADAHVPVGHTDAQRRGGRHAGMARLSSDSRPQDLIEDLDHAELLS